MLVFTVHAPGLLWNRTWVTRLQLAEEASEKAFTDSTANLRMSAPRNDRHRAIVHYRIIGRFTKTACRKQSRTAGTEGNLRSTPQRPRTERNLHRSGRLSTSTK